MDRDAILEIIRVGKKLDEKGLVNSFEGNISIKKNGLIYITPTGKDKASLTEEMVAIIDSDGNQVGGSCKPTSELPMHTDTYEIRDDIGAVVHAHPPYLTAYSLCNMPVETRAYPEMMGNFTRFECAPYGRPGTSAILEGAIPILKYSNIVVLGNHGVLVVGKDAEEAMNRAIAAEAIAKTLFLTKQLGLPCDLPDSECDFFFSLNGNAHE